jgi:hypothetical protein
VISIELARQLRSAGVRWTPAAGDRFVVVDRGMDDEVFVVSEMTVEVHQLPQGPVIGFNGTTEWALDSVEDREAVWLPRETQLRELLAGTFRQLNQTEGGWQVTIAVNGTPFTVEDSDVEQVYGRALLHLVTD